LIALIDSTFFRQIAGLSIALALRTGGRELPFLLPFISVGGA